MTKYQAGDRVNVYTSGNEAAMATHGHIADQPRAATIERELLWDHPTTYEVTYDDDGSSEMINDTQRFRPLPADPSKPKK